MQAGRTICATDATWKWSDQTRYRQARADWPNIYDVVDARVEDGDWTLPDYDDSKWAATQPAENSWGELTARRIPLLRETVVEPVWKNETNWPLTLNAGGEASFKFKHLVLAYVQIEMDADEGSVLELTYSQPTKIICRAGKQTYISTDTHSIFEAASASSPGGHLAEREVCRTALSFRSSRHF